MMDRVTRIAARGDGVTAQGKHIAGGVTGDMVTAQGEFIAGPHHQVPPCRHFGTCGGCQLQHADDTALAQFVTDRVVHAAQTQGLSIGSLLPTHLSPPRSRRRATLHGMKTRKGAILGFREARSHRIVNLRECHVLEPDLFALVDPLRRLIADYATAGTVKIFLTIAEEGVDCLIEGELNTDLAAVESIVAFASAHHLARLAIDRGYCAETVWEPAPVHIRFGSVRVGLPAGAFLQPTRDGEARLVQDARDYVGSAKTIADLFAGLGTFSFALNDSAKVLAVEAARDAHLACSMAAKMQRPSLLAMHRDLYRAPLTAQDISRFDAVVLDPPRAGAREQVAQICESSVARVVYVSCNPASWARDAKALAVAGFTLDSIRPVGQFRWSTHVELTSYFTR